jgi:hypothetical protein
MGLFNGGALSGLCIAATATACAGEIVMPDEDLPDTGEECTDPGYGDGTCDPDLDCAAPDIDCFLTFSSQEEVEGWYRPLEENLAQAAFRNPFVSLPTSDARWTRMRQLLDVGWDGYQEVLPVGDLAAFKPGLVVLETPQVNAFATSDPTGHVGLAVIVYTGLIETMSDEELVGVVMHELTHGIRLHVLPNVGDTYRRFYVAASGEPFGFEQTDDAMARQHVEDWRALASDAGAFTEPALDLMPMGGGMVPPRLYRVFNAVLNAYVEADPTACSTPATAYNQLMQEIMGYYSGLDQRLHIEGLEEEVAAAVNQALTDVRDVCLPGLTDSYVAIMATINDKTEAEIRTEMSDEDEALVDGKHFVEAIAALLADRRAKMRDTQVAFEAAAGVTWSRARFYSTEEDADDSTVPVLEAMGRAPDGIAGGLFLLQDEPTRTACQEVLDAGTVPAYGANLLDEHHANCWRVRHVRDVAASGRLSSRRSRRPVRSDASEAPRSRYRPIPMPPSQWDRVLF